MKLDHLLGFQFRLGSSDCYGAARAYFSSIHGIELRDYARPNDFWDHGLDLYTDHFRSEGFDTFNGHPKDWREGDVILMAIRSSVPNHCAILLEDGRIFHHLVGGPSRIENYNRPIFRDTTVGVLRHPAVARREQPTISLNSMELLPDELRQKFAAAVPR